MNIVVDSREAAAASKILEYLRNKHQVTVTKLLAGDYLVGSVLVERKTANDYITSIITRRLWEQLSTLVKAEDLEPVLLLEGSITAALKYRKLHAGVVIGAIASTIVDWKVPVVMVPTAEWTVMIIDAIAKNVESRGIESKLRSVRFLPRALTPDEELRAVVEGLPGIGPQLADSLLKKFGTLRRLFNASASELREVEGIGKKRADKLEEVFNRQYKK